MSFDEEWARLVAAARERKAVHTQLNQHGSGSSSTEDSNAKLLVTPSVLRGRANKLEHTVAPDFNKAQKSASDKTADVPGSMRGFASDEALGTFLKRWKDQVRHMDEMLGSDGLAGSLRAAANAFTTEDEARRDSFDSGKHEYREGDII
ncbi:MAG TPA: type VII secretion target [Streptomyces sp.]|nr:type VII secretion target [Streptomyces sp.]